MGRVGLIFPGWIKLRIMCLHLVELILLVCNNDIQQRECRIKNSMVSILCYGPVISCLPPGYTDLRTHIYICVCVFVCVYIYNKDSLSNTYIMEV